MKTFVTKLILFAALQAAVAGVVYLGYLKRAPRNETYFAVAHDKHAAMTASSPPRVVFLGGSSVPFSLDSAALSEELGVKVVNLGLHVGLGLAYILNEAESLLQPGDAAVLALEYELYTNLLGHTQYLLQQAEAMPAAMRHFEPAHWREIMDRGAVIRAGIITKLVLGNPKKLFEPGVSVEWTQPGPYNRRGFNTLGDITAPRAGPLPVADRDVALAGFAFNEAAAQPSLTALREFCNRSKTRGIRVALVHPPLDERHFAKSQTAIAQLDLVLAKEVPAPFLDTATEAVLPHEFYFDTRYHLNSRGVKRRTELLSDKLGQWWRGGGPPDPVQQKR